MFKLLIYFLTLQFGIALFQLIPGLSSFLLLGFLFFQLVGIYLFLLFLIDLHTYPAHLSGFVLSETEKNLPKI